MTDFTRCDACGVTTAPGNRRGWVSIRYFKPAVWDNPEVSEDGVPGIDYDACSANCARRVLELATLEAA